MTKQEIDDYFNDKEEQDRQNSPGLRHRNKETIKCRYSFINSIEKIKESLDQIERDKINGDNFDLKYYSASKIINNNYLGINEINELNNNTKRDKTYENQFAEYAKHSLSNETENFDPNPTKTLILLIHGGW